MLLGRERLVTCGQSLLLSRVGGSETDVDWLCSQQASPNAKLEEHEACLVKLQAAKALSSLTLAPKALGEMLLTYPVQFDRPLEKIRLQATILGKALGGSGQQLN